MNKTNTVLCVDDEPRVLEGLTLHLGRKYQVLTATGGDAALSIIRNTPELAVIVSDMRMPGMNGASFLSHARQLAPTAVRILLSGQADLKTSMAAVNEGHIYGFLAKPCMPSEFMDVISSAIEQHRLLVGQQQQLENSLDGSILALLHMLECSHPTAFARSNRILQLVRKLALELGISQARQVERAAQLSQLGVSLLPSEILEKYHNHGPLSEEEKTLLVSLPKTVDQLLASIPGLEQARAILLGLVNQAHEGDQDKTVNNELRIGSRILKVAVDFDELQQEECANAIEVLQGREGQYDHEILQALRVVHSAVNSAVKLHSRIRELKLSSLQEGMVLANDIYLVSGSLLVHSGFQLTQDFLERIQNYRAGTIREPIRVVLPMTP